MTHNWDLLGVDIILKSGNLSGYANHGNPSWLPAPVSEIWCDDCDRHCGQFYLIFSSSPAYTDKTMLSNNFTWDSHKNLGILDFNEMSAEFATFIAIQKFIPSRHLD